MASSRCGASISRVSAFSNAPWNLRQCPPVVVQSRGDSVFPDFLRVPSSQCGDVRQTEVKPEGQEGIVQEVAAIPLALGSVQRTDEDRKSTRLNSSHT